MKKLILTLAVGIFAWQCSSGPALSDRPGSAQALEKHVSYLASDELGGRKPGTDGGRKAAAYLRKQFKASGLTLLGEDGYQHFQVVKTITAGENNALNIGDFQGSPGENFTPLAFSANTSLTAEIVFAGYGFHFSNDSIARNDYNNLDISGKWALIMRGDPEMDNPDSPYLPFASLRNKVITATDHGAAGVLFVSGSEFDSKDELVDLYYEGSKKSAPIPVIQIKREIADKLLAPAKLTVDSTELVLQNNYAFSPVALKTVVSARTDIVKTMTETQNVVAVLPGSDAALKNEYIVIGAHYDHIGTGGPGSGSRRPDTLAIHNGADDNASGTAAMLELARSLSQRRKALPRSIVFIGFGAEEMGLLGSKHFTNNPLVDIENIALMMNLDMVGSYIPDSTILSIGGTGTAIGFGTLLDEYAYKAKIELNLSRKGYGPSDHSSFYTKDIPVLFFFTGAHKRYHTPDDDIKDLNYYGMNRIVGFVGDLAENFANSRKELVFQEAGPKTSDNYRRRFKVTLGIMPDHASEVEGLRIEVVVPGRPAALAGMENGDVIIAMDGKPVGDIYEYMHRLSEFRSGQRISVDILRGSEELILIADL